MPSHETPSRLIHAMISGAGRKGFEMGPKGTYRPIDADVMGQVAERIGIPKARIILDSHSNNTMVS